MALFYTRASVKSTGEHWGGLASFLEETANVANGANVGNAGNVGNGAVYSKSRSR
jgi:hypothetical protein